MRVILLERRVHKSWVTETDQGQRESTRTEQTTIQWSTVTMSNHSSIYHCNLVSSQNMKLLVSCTLLLCRILHKQYAVSPLCILYCKLIEFYFTQFVCRDWNFVQVFYLNIIYSTFKLTVKHCSTPFLDDHR